MTAHANRPTFAEMLPRVRAFYAMPGNSVGGLLHIVLDDGNIRDSDVQWCIEQAVAALDMEAEFLGRDILRMSKRGRSRLADADHRHKP